MRVTKLSFQKRLHLQLQLSSLFLLRTMQRWQHGLHIRLAELLQILAHLAYLSLIDLHRSAPDNCGIVEPSVLVLGRITSGVCVSI